MFSVIILLSILVLFPGCQRGNTDRSGASPTPAGDPPSVARTYLQSLAEKKFDKAWEVLSSGSRNRVAESLAYNVPRARLMLDTDEGGLRTKFFARQVKGVDKMYARLAAEADIRLKSSNERKAVVTVSRKGKSLDFTLVKEENGWKMDLFSELRKK
jgi:sirohydrochlorin ferrochelatase